MPTLNYQNWPLIGHITSVMGWTALLHHTS